MGLAGSLGKKYGSAEKYRGWRRRTAHVLFTGSSGWRHSSGAVGVVVVAGGGGGVAVAIAGRSQDFSHSSLDGKRF